MKTNPAQFEPVCSKILELLHTWEAKLLTADAGIISSRKNSQGRTVKQIVGHLVDSASNNIHRIVHLQYEPSPLNFPDYAHFGNNDRWIAIQNYKDTDWIHLVQLWKFSLLHIVHVIRNIDSTKLENEWISALNEKITLLQMATDFPRHLELHLNEIDDLLTKPGV